MLDVPNRRSSSRIQSRKVIEDLTSELSRNGLSVMTFVRDERFVEILVMSLMDWSRIES